jgi:hypothetical protein
LSELQTVSITIGILTACVGVVIGVANSIMSNRREEKRRKTQIIMQLFDRMQEKDLREAFTDLRQNEWKNYEDWREKHNPQTNAEAWSSFVSMMAYYNGVSILVQQGLIDDIGLVDELLGYQIFTVWQDSEFIIKQWRKHRRVPWKKPMYQSLELLANQIQQRWSKQASPST